MAEVRKVMGVGVKVTVAEEMAPGMVTVAAEMVTVAAATAAAAARTRHSCRSLRWRSGCS
jgi:hypothetical protein